MGLHNESRRLLQRHGAVYGDQIIPVDHNILGFLVSVLKDICDHLRLARM